MFKANSKIYMKNLINLITVSILIFLTGCGTTEQWQTFGNQMQQQQQQNLNAAEQRTAESRARLDRANDRLLNNWNNPPPTKQNNAPKTYRVRDQNGNISTYTVEPE